MGAKESAVKALAAIARSGTLLDQVVDMMMKVEQMKKQGVRNDL